MRLVNRGPRGNPGLPALRSPLRVCGTKEESDSIPLGLRGPGRPRPVPGFALTAKAFIFPIQTTLWPSGGGLLPADASADLMCIA